MQKRTLQEIKNKISEDFSERAAYRKWLAEKNSARTKKWKAREKLGLNKDKRQKHYIDS